MTRRILAIVVILSETRESPPSSTFPAAPAIDCEGETVSEETRPIAKCNVVVPFARSLRKVG